MDDATKSNVMPRCRGRRVTDRSRPSVLGRPGRLTLQTKVGHPKTGDSTVAGSSSGHERLV